MLNEVGRLCVKLAGRDANKKCVVVEVIDETHVLIDGETRRRKCNVKHLEPLNQVIKLKAGALRADVIKAFKDLGIELRDTKTKKPTEKPKKQRIKKTSIDKLKTAKKSEKKVVAKKEKPVVSEEKLVVEKSE